MKLNTVCFWEPEWWYEEGCEKYHDKHPLNYGDKVYYMGDIPDVIGHCLVLKRGVGVLDMIHTDELRKATEEEL